MYLSRVGFASRNRPAASAQRARPYIFDHLAEQSQSFNDLLLNGGPVDRRHEFVARNFRCFFESLVSPLLGPTVWNFRMALSCHPPAERLPSSGNTSTNLTIRSAREHRDAESVFQLQTSS